MNEAGHFFLFSWGNPQVIEGSCTMHTDGAYRCIGGGYTFLCILYPSCMSFFFISDSVVACIAYGEQVR